MKYYVVEYDGVSRKYFALARLPDRVLPGDMEPFSFVVSGPFDREEAARDDRIGREALLEVMES